MTRAILYARFSPRPTTQKAAVRSGRMTAREADELTIAQQLDRDEDYCRSKGYRVEGRFDDPQASGADEDRPGLWRAVEAMRRGWVLVCYDCKRLARDTYLAAYIQRLADRGGWRIEYVEGGFNGDDPDSRFIRGILDQFAARERQIIAIRTSLGMRRNQRNGRRQSYHVPYGTRLDAASPGTLVTRPDGSEVVLPTLLEANPEESGAVARILALKEAGAGLREICRRLAEEGFQPRGSEWHHKTVRRIIRRAEA